MVSYLMQKDADENRMRRKYGGRIVNAHDLAQSALLLELQSERKSVSDLEETEMSLQLNNTALSDVVEIQDALVWDLKDKVAVFEENRVVLKASLRQLHREMRDEAPGHAKVVEDLEA